jgi:hypothetical protein
MVRVPGYRLPVQGTWYQVPGTGKVTIYQKASSQKFSEREPAVHKILTQRQAADTSLGLRVISTPSSSPLIQLVSYRVVKQHHFPELHASLETRNSPHLTLA